MLTTPHCKNWLVMIREHLSRTWIQSSVRPTQQKRDMNFDMWNVRCLYRAVTLTAAARELVRYELDLMGVQEVRWDKWGTLTTSS